MTAEIRRPLDNLTPQGRAALVTYLLMKRESMTTRQLVEVTGITGAAVRSMMDNLSVAGVPVYKPAYGEWAILKEGNSWKLDLS